MRTPSVLQGPHNEACARRKVAAELQSPNQTSELPGVPVSAAAGGWLRVVYRVAVCPGRAVIDRTQRSVPPEHPNLTTGTSGGIRRALPRRSGSRGVKRLPYHRGSVGRYDPRRRIPTTRCRPAAQQRIKAGKNTRTLLVSSRLSGFGISSSGAAADPHNLRLRPRRCGAIWCVIRQQVSSSVELGVAA